MEQKIIIVIPMYNAEKSIRNAINSVLAQQDVNVQIVVVDHGSSDLTWECVQKYINEPNSRVTGLKLNRTKNERRSASRPLNEGIRCAISKCDDMDNTWMMRLDSDDVLNDKETLSCLIQHATSQLKLLSGKIIFINSEEKKAEYFSQSKKYDSIESLRTGAAYAYPHHATLIKATLIDELLYETSYCYSEELGYGEDMDFSLRLFNKCNENEICFTHIPMIIKELSGDTISNRICYKLLIHDHILIFLRNQSLSRRLLFNIILWFSFDKFGKIGKWINTFRMAPAFKYIDTQETDYEAVSQRKNMWAQKHMS